MSLVRASTRPNYPTAAQYSEKRHGQLVLALALSLVLHGWFMDMGASLLNKNAPPPALPTVTLAARLLPPKLTPPQRVQEIVAPTPQIRPRVDKPVKSPPATKAKKAATKSISKTTTLASNQNTSSPTKAALTPNRSQARRPQNPAAINAQAIAHAAKRLQENLPYPLEAIRQGLQGEAVVLIFTDDQGRIIAARLENSSGYKLLDDAAVRTARHLGTLPEVGRSEILLRVPFYLR